MDPIHQELLRQAVEAAKNNDIDTAIAKVKEVLEEDEENAKAWLLLARLTTNNDEKRIALATILQLDPTNDKAKELLAKLDTQVKTRDEVEVLPGVSRGLLRMIVGGLVVFVLLMVGLIALIGQNRSAAEAQETRVAQAQAVTQQAIYSEQTLIIERETQIAVDLTAAFFAVNPPTLTPSPTLFPSETPLPSATPTPTLIPPPSDLSGMMVGRSTRSRAFDQQQPIVIFSLTGGRTIPFANLRGFSMSTFTGNSQFAVVSENPDSNFVKEIVLYDVDGLEIPSNLSSAEAAAAYIEAFDATFSVDGSLIVFVGRTFGQERNDIFILNLATTVPSEIIRKITTDTATYRNPSLSPDGTRVVAVREVIEGDNLGIDLVIIDVRTSVPTSLTTDRNTLIETMPRWDTASSLVVYAARPQADTNHEIYFIDVRNADSGSIRISQPASDEIMPMFSPDGRYLAYSSNVSGQYQVFVQNLTTNESFQLTFDDSNNIINDWR
jgi:hypothetical protein